MTLAIITFAIGLAVPCAEGPKDQAPPPPPAVAEPVLRDELIKRMKAEQDVRTEFLRVLPASETPAPEAFQRPEVKTLLERMNTIDHDNQTWLKGVIEKHGWPRRSQVGQDGTQAAFLIAQHAAGDLEFMAKCLPLLKSAHQAGEAKGEWVALMTDRLLIMKDKKKQLYGTQLMAQDGKLVPQPIEDEANVDSRRRALGMPPLADYLKLANASQPSPAKPFDPKPEPPKKKQ
jgi:hypothetical protein